MGEFVDCPNCNNYINLEIDIYRIGIDIYCKKCHKKIVWEEGENNRISNLLK